MFAYKAAVALKNIGYTHLMIYNGGVKDWKKSGNPTTRRQPLGDYEIPMLTSDEVFELTRRVATSKCRDSEGKPLLTFLDLRIELSLPEVDKPVMIASECETVVGLLDELQSPMFRSRLPDDSLIVTVTETGNRDIFAGRFLMDRGYRNIKRLRFGMRGWLKAGYPTTAAPE